MRQTARGRGRALELHGPATTVHARRSPHAHHHPLNPRLWLQRSIRSAGARSTRLRADQSQRPRLSASPDPHHPSPQSRASGLTRSLSTAGGPRTRLHKHLARPALSACMRHECLDGRPPRRRARSPIGADAARIGSGPGSGLAHRYRCRSPRDTTPSTPIPPTGKLPPTGKPLPGAPPP